MYLRKLFVITFNLLLLLSTTLHELLRSRSSYLINFVHAHQIFVYKVLFCSEGLFDTYKCIETFPVQCPGEAYSWRNTIERNPNLTSYIPVMSICGLVMIEYVLRLDMIFLVHEFIDWNQQNQILSDLK